MRKMQIGEFSKLTRLSVKALRHYDTEGLLVPAAIDERTGYRYYNDNQLKSADSIRVLRSLDMPLREIAALLQSADTDQTISGLQEHRHRIQQEIAAKRRIADYLDALIGARELLLNYEICIEKVEPQTIASVEFTAQLSSIGQSIQMGFGELIRGLQASGLQPAAPPVIVYHDVIDAEAAGRIEVGIPVPTEAQAKTGLSLRQLEGGLVARTLHTGSYQSIGPAYQALAGWIAEHRYEVTGPPREQYLNDPQTTPEHELLTAIEFPVKQH